MTDATNPDAAGTGSPDDPSAVKDPSEWVTGGEPATGAQKSYLSTLAREAGEDVPGELTKGEASQLIEEMQTKSPRVDEN